MPGLQSAVTEPRPPAASGDSAARGTGCAAAGWEAQEAQEAQEAHQEARLPATTHGIAKSMFALHAGRDEYIDGDELRQLCNGMGRELNAREHADVMARLDTSGDGRVCFDEFLVWWDVGLSVEALLDESVAANVRSISRAGKVAVVRERASIAAASASAAAASSSSAAATDGGGGVGGLGAGADEAGQAQRRQRKMDLLHGWDADAAPSKERPERSFGRESSATKHHGLQRAQETRKSKMGQAARLGAIHFAGKLRQRSRERSQEPAGQLPPPTQQASAGAAGSGSGSGRGPKEASGGWDSSCLAAASTPGVGSRAPPRTPEQVCLSIVALDALEDPSAHLSA